MKRKFQRLTWVVAFCLVTLFSCVKNNNANTNAIKGANSDVDALLALNTAASFNFETATDVKVFITVLAPDNSPIKSVVVSVLDKAAALGGTILYKGMTDATGKISGTVKLPGYITQVIVAPQYAGVINNAAVAVTGGSILCTLGGSTGYAGNVILNSPLSGKINENNTATNFKTKLAYLGSFDIMGKPNYLLPVNEPISANLLADINMALPESKSITISHPAYLANNVETNIHINKTSDVYFTFVSEGAGFRNTIAYFTYPTNNPPQSTSEIDSLIVILPNASLLGSGGSLQAGNTINLGQFNAGTSIGFALMANAFNATTGLVGNGYWTVYSLAQLNEETNVNLKRHSVLLYDVSRLVFLVGFEDVLRDPAHNSDNDFNDVLFYIKANADIANIPELLPAPPPVGGYTNSYKGTLAFEDNWPYLGDYDMNDIVVGYNYDITFNGSNQATNIKAQYILKASGATYRSGFGVQFPFSSTLVQSATGSLVKNNQIVNTGSNGCENGQTNAVIIPFDDAFTAMNSNGWFNTVIGAPYLTRDTINMYLNFTRPLTIAELGTAPFNPFIFVDHLRGREVHLAGYQPTDLVNTKYFGTGVDNTIVGLKSYYKTKSNLPWGLAFMGDFNYPIEMTSINAAYPAFIPWALSNGTTNTNWYNDASTMVSKYIYQK